MLTGNKTLDTIAARLPARWRRVEVLVQLARPQGDLSAEEDRRLAEVQLGNLGADTELPEGSEREVIAKLTSDTWSSFLGSAPGFVRSFPGVTFELRQVAVMAHTAEEIRDAGAYLAGAFPDLELVKGRGRDGMHEWTAVAA